MPREHRLYSEWNKERFIHWAESIGPATLEVVEKLFTTYRVEEQAYKGCLSLLKLADKYTSDRVEGACKVALAHIPNPRYKNISLILKAGQDLPATKQRPETATDDINQYTHLRGAAYYGGGKDEK